MSHAPYLLRKIIVVNEGEALLKWKMVCLQSQLVGGYLPSDLISVRGRTWGLGELCSKVGEYTPPQEQKPSLDTVCVACCIMKSKILLDTPYTHPHHPGRKQHWEANVSAKCTIGKKRNPPRKHKYMITGGLILGAIINCNLLLWINSHI